MNQRNSRRRIILLLNFLIAGSLLFIAFFVSTCYYQNNPANPAFLLQINEICTVNPGTPYGDALIYEDYVELYNPSDQEISLDHVFLSDSTKDFSLGPLPADTIKPGEYYVIYADKKEGLPFRLSETETLTLSYCAGPENSSQSYSPIDSIFIPPLERGTVYARPNDKKEALCPMRPSPGESNQTASLVLESPVFSVDSGFYDGPLSLQIQAPEACSVYYTLDGSNPGPDTILYTEPLVLSDPSLQDSPYSSHEDITSGPNDYLSPKTPVDKAVILRAAAYDEAGNYSNTVTAVYFLDYKEKAGYENTAVLSLVTDPSNLFDNDMGIYVRGSRYDHGIENIEISPDLPWSELTEYLNYYIEGTASERPAHLTFFDSKHGFLLEQECGIRIRGNESRNFPQKSFTLFSRNRYEAKTFSPVFFDTGIAYPNLILNNSSELKKVFFFSLTADRAAAVQQYTPCQVFLNGEYWGMYYLMEKYSSEYLESYYGAAKENTVLIKNSWEIQDGNPKAASSFHDLQEYLKQDMSDPDLYEKLLLKMDMQSFIDWMCTNIYIANTDTKPLGGNVFTWRVVTPAENEYQDGRWRWMLYDLDDSLGVGIDTDMPSYMIDSFTEHAGYAPCGFLEDEPMPSLMGNEDFRRQFVLSFMDMANENFKSSRVMTLLDDIETQYASAASKSYERWNTSPLNTTFDEQAEELRTFFANRYDAIVPYLAEHFSLKGDLVPLTLSADNPEGGTVTLNTLTLDLSTENWLGNYYTDYPITLTAVPSEGYTFIGWEAEDCQILSDDSSSELQVRLLDDTYPVINAVFEKLP